jgi:hypothetical protein
VIEQVCLGTKAESEAVAWALVYACRSSVSERSGILVAGADALPYNHSHIVYMKCPFCRHDIAATWQAFSSNTDELGRLTGLIQSQLNTHVLRDKNQTLVQVIVHWLKCQNCFEIVVQITRSESGTTKSWIALPKNPGLPFIDPLVTDPFRKDYLEAWTILEDSPRMSAVLSRRLLADLLEKYASLKQFRLEDRVDQFIQDTRHPLWIRENLHYLREAGNFGAHTQQDKTTVLPVAPTAAPADPPIIDVGKDEAEWILKGIADLFEYFIVAPQKDKEMRTAIDKKVGDAGRKAIKPLTT